jgi:hypothetical protein
MNMSEGLTLSAFTRKESTCTETAALPSDLHKAAIYCDAISRFRRMSKFFCPLIIKMVASGTLPLHPVTAPLLT